MVAAALSIPTYATSDVPSTTTSTTTTTTTPPSSTTTTTPTSTTTTTIPRSAQLPWPSMGSAAVSVPLLSVAATSPRQPRVPIASLTKMMTTWVVLQKLPLAYNQSGPCLNVSAGDMAVYEHDVATGQSNVKEALGEHLCEGTLLRGMLVHSAGNYAELLTDLVGLHQAQFVAIMNRDARALGLKNTHYVDYTGISPGDVSTAQDQSVIEIALMTNEPIVRSIVALTSVKLPVAGVVGSYTPLDGEYGVVGVKSGFTDPAGGCDAMAVNSVINDTVVTTYAVVLGIQGADAIDRAGQFALNISQAVRAKLRAAPASSGTSVQWVGWPGYQNVPPVTTTTTTTTTTSTTTTLPSV